MVPISRCDEFGNYNCKEFTMNYSGESKDAFNLMMETDCSAAYQFRPNIDKGKHFLLPCEQPDEREKRQKWQNQLLVTKLIAANNRTPSPSPTPTK